MPAFPKVKRVTHNELMARLEALETCLIVKGIVDQEWLDAMLKHIKQKHYKRGEMIPNGDD